MGNREKVLPRFRQIKRAIGIRFFLELREQLNAVAPVGSHRPIAIRTATDRTVLSNEGEKIYLA
jgi:hypothetical protein